MTERLSTLLRDEAAGYDVPAPDAAAVLRRAQGMRRRRRGLEAVVGLVVVAAVVAVGTGITGVRGDGGQDATAAASYRQRGAFAVGSVLHVGSHEVHFESTVTSIYYTSAGVLVRRGPVADGDTDGPTLYTLVRPDGSARDLSGLDVGDRVPGTDVDSPYLTYAEPHGEASAQPSATTRWDLVAVDVRTGAEVARRAIDGAFTWGGWQAPPVSTHGTRIWALLDQGWVEYDWATGNVRTVPGTAGATLEAAHGLYADEEPPRWVVRDFATGTVLRTEEPKDPDLGGFLSPDGRYGRVLDDYLSTDGVPPATPARFVTLTTGAEVTLPGSRFYGWTPDGGVLAFDPRTHTVSVCDPGTGDCGDARKVGDGRVRLGGLSYES